MGRVYVTTTQAHCHYAAVSTRQLHLKSVNDQLVEKNDKALLVVFQSF